MKIIGIYREPIFSPGKVREDAAILDAVLYTLSIRGYKTAALSAEMMSSQIKTADLILNMAQSEHCLGVLEQAAGSGIPVFNSPAAVRNCCRKSLFEIFSRSEIPMPAGRIESIRTMQASGFFRQPYGYWIKRGDQHALGPGDVSRIDSCSEFSCAIDHFRRQGIDHVLVQAHVDGPCAKFYGVGVAPGGFFRAFLPGSGTDITSLAGQLAETARSAAGAVGLDIYGGDAILAADGTWMLIDLNAWPTFSLCRESAAWAIVHQLERNNARKGVCNEIS